MYGIYSEFHTGQASSKTHPERENSQNVAGPHTDTIGSEQPHQLSGQANCEAEARKGHAKWAAADKQGRVPNVWIDDPRITPDALAILQFMAVHPGWKLKRAYMERSRSKGGPGWSPPRYIKVRRLLIDLGIIDKETRKLVMPLNVETNWTPALRGEARDALFAGRRGTKAAVVRLYVKRFKSEPDRAEIAKRFRLSTSTMQRIDRSKPNGSIQSKPNGSTRSKPNGVSGQNLTDTPDELATQDEATKEAERHEQYQRSKPDAGTVRYGSAHGASLDFLTHPDTLDLIGRVWQELADVIGGDGSTEEPAMQVAVMVAMATHDEREINEIVSELRRARWDHVSRPCGYARRAIERIIGTKMVVLSSVVSAAIHAYDARQSAHRAAAAPRADTPAPKEVVPDLNDQVTDFDNLSEPNAEFSGEVNPAMDEPEPARQSDQPQPVEPEQADGQLPGWIAELQRGKPRIGDRTLDHAITFFAGTDHAHASYRVMIKAGVDRDIAAGMAVTFSRQKIDIKPHLSAMKAVYKHSGGFWKSVKAVYPKASRVSMNDHARRVVADYFDATIAWRAKHGVNL